MHKDNKEVEEIQNLMMNQNFFKTNAQKVKKQIEEDVKNGQGAMSSREAGGKNK